MAQRRLVSRRVPDAACGLIRATHNVVLQRRWAVDGPGVLAPWRRWGATTREPGATIAHAARDSTDKLGFQADRHRRQRLGDRAVLLGVVGDGAELLLVDAGDLRLELEADLRQRRAAFQREVDLGAGIQRGGGEA